MIKSFLCLVTLTAVVSQPNPGRAQETGFLQAPEEGEHWIQTPETEKDRPLVVTGALLTAIGASATTASILTFAFSLHADNASAGVTAGFAMSLPSICLLGSGLAILTVAGIRGSDRQRNNRARLEWNQPLTTPPRTLDPDKVAGYIRYYQIHYRKAEKVVLAGVALTMAGASLAGYCGPRKSDRLLI